MTDVVKFDISDYVATITINRPEAMNSMNPEVRLGLSQALDEVEQNKDIWIAVITGEGEKSFSAGADLKHFAKEKDATKDQKKSWKKMLAQTRPLTERWYFPKPIIAQVNGFALGGGLELALACDIIVAAEHAEFGLPEPRRGLIAGGGGVHRLPRMIGLKQAMGYMLTGRHMSANRAFELGLVNEVVKSSNLEEAVNKWIIDIKKCSPLSIRATKEAAMRGLDMPLAQAYHMHYDSERTRAQGSDTKEGPKAFAEKREPIWSGE